ncbi:MAG: hypothetical protein ACR2QS_00830 [Woeseiaceae bacterium]
MAFLPLALILISCEVASDEDPAPPAAEPVSLDCGPNGYLTTELFGALAGKIEWKATDLVCEGMPRPDGDGARLRFAGTVEPDFEIAFIIALPDLNRGETGKELRSKITIIEEGAGRFFSNADQDTCWTDIDELVANDDAETQFDVGGSLYCVAPLVEINGESDITLGDLTFRGLLDWEAS